MSKHTNSQLLQDTLGMFVGILVYNLLFHSNQPIVPTLVRSAVVALIVGAILYFLRRGR